MRGGLVPFLVWAGWRLLQKPGSEPSTAVIWTAIVLSAVPFGAGHLPMTRLLLGRLSRSAITQEIAGGTVFGSVAGLYCRYGLEAAMICHAASHVLAYAAYKTVSK